MITTPQASQLSGLSVAYLGSLAKQGIIEGRKYGRDWMLYKDSFDSFMARPRKPGPKGPTGPKKRKQPQEGSAGNGDGTR